jgi:hypothetical protein
MTDKLVTIHGSQWKYDDVREAIEAAQKVQWNHRKWKPRAALISRDHTSDYRGQQYDPQYTKLDEYGWTHDHCDICWWTLHEADDPEQGEGYTTDGHRWICAECFRQFIKSGA